MEGQRYSASARMTSPNLILILYIALSLRFHHEVLGSSRMSGWILKLPHGLKYST